MRRIRNDLKKMIKANCSANEYKFAIYLSAHQDILGHVPNLNHNEVIELLNISRSEYYWMLDRMDRKMIKGMPEKPVPKSCPKCGTNIIENKHYFACENCTYKINKDPFDRPRLIYVDRTFNQRYWNITLLNNSFSNISDIAKTTGGSLDIRHNFILTKEFMSTSKKAFCLAMDLLGFMDEKEPYKKYQLTRRSILRWIGTTSMKVVEKTIKELDKWFVISIDKNGKYLIYLKEIYHKKDTTEIIVFSNKVIELCRYYKLRIKAVDAIDIARLAGQYKRRIKKLGLDSIILLKEVVSMIINKYREIEAKLVHKIYREYIIIKEREKKKSSNNNSKDYIPNESNNIKNNKNYRSNGKPTFNNFKNREYDTDVLKKELLEKAERSMKDIKEANESSETKYKDYILSNNEV